MQVTPLSQLSPIYLSAAKQQPHCDARVQSLFANNAKVLATYLINPDSDFPQVLHLIDSPIHFGYKAATSALLGRHSRMRTTKRAFDLQDVVTEPQILVDFQDRLAQSQAAAALSDDGSMALLEPRAFLDSRQTTRARLSASELSLAHVNVTQLRRLLSATTTGNALNTFFLPVPSLSDDSASVSFDARALEQLFARQEVLAAHTVPNEALFVRPVGLGARVHTLFDSLTGGRQTVALSFAKATPNILQSDGGSQLGPDSSDDPTHDLAHLWPQTTPLLVQSSCAGASSVNPTDASCTRGLVTSEVLLANVPLTNGVLHIIRQPLLVPHAMLSDFLNDSSGALSLPTRALGSASAKLSAQQQQAASCANYATSKAPHKLQQVTKFRQLVARAPTLLSAFFLPTQAGNRSTTIVMPSDDAFDALRYDIRALLDDDASLAHEERQRRQAARERIVRRHVLGARALTSDAYASSPLLEQSELFGEQLRFERTSAESEQVSLVSANESADGSKALSAQIMHADLSATNGVVMVVDSVLGEPLETMASLLEASLVGSGGFGDDAMSLKALLADLDARVASATQLSAAPQANAEDDSGAQSNTLDARPNDEKAAKLRATAKAVDGLLVELAASRNKRTLELLGASVNISCALARLTQLDAVEQFADSSKLFTYFVPSDLAWLRLQAQLPELYKPLAFALDEHSASDAANGDKLALATHAFRQVSVF